MKKEIKELSSDKVLMSAYLLLEDAKQLKANLAMELDLARDRRLAQEKEFKEFMYELWGTLRKIQAQFKVEAQFLNLIKPKAGEKENETRFMARFTK
jgi:hypothetical protein